MGLSYRASARNCGGTGIFLVGGAHIGIIDFRWVHSEVPQLESLHVRPINSP